MVKEKIISIIATGVLLAVLIFASTITTFARSCKQYGRSSMVTPQMYEAVINTLRAHADPATAGTMYDTGIVCTNDDFLQIKWAIRHMFLGNREVLIMANTYGQSNLHITNVTETDCEYNYSLYCDGPSHPTPTIYVGFRPGSDPVELMRQHDTAYATLARAVASSPDGDYDFYLYCYDYVRGLGSYDYELSRNSHCAYTLIAERKGVCEAFTSTFLMMCWLKGRECLYLKLDNNTHSAAVFQSGGTYYKADFTKCTCIVPTADNVTEYVSGPFFVD